MGIHRNEWEHPVGRLRRHGVRRCRYVLSRIRRQSAGHDEPTDYYQHERHGTWVDAVALLALAVTTATLTGCSGCGGLIADDAGIDAPADIAVPDVTGPVPMTCGSAGAPSDAAPFSANVVTCPLGWHCAAYHISGPGSDTYCCPAGHGTSLTYDPACQACPCISPRCCTAGMQCGSAMTNVCDGG